MASSACFPRKQVWASALPLTVMERFVYPWGSNTEENYPEALQIVENEVAIVKGYGREARRVFWFLLVVFFSLCRRCDRMPAALCPGQGACHHQSEGRCQDN